MTRTMGALSLLLSVGCSVATEEFDTNDAPASTHAVIRVRHSELQDGSMRGDALTGFVHVPSGTDPQSVFTLAGLVTPLPAIGDCQTEGPIGEGLDLSSISQSELLEVDSIELLTPVGSHSLTPFAFPTVADLLRGVVYTSRDQDASELPTGVKYSVEARGVNSPDTETTRDFSSQHESPRLPENVTISGTPLHELSRLPPSGVLDLTWNGPEDSLDTILIALTNEQTTWKCSFSDSDGYASVPLLTDTGIHFGEDGSEVQLEVHRLRSISQGAEDALAEVRVTFDFSRETSFRFTDSKN